MLTNPPGSHAWCSEPDCDWTDDSNQCEARARVHCDTRLHLVHVYEPTT